MPRRIRRRQRRSVCAFRLPRRRVSSLMRGSPAHRPGFLGFRTTKQRPASNGRRPRVWRTTHRAQALDRRGLCVEGRLIVACDSAQGEGQPLRLGRFDDSAISASASSTSRRKGWGMDLPGSFVALRRYSAMSLRRVAAHSGSRVS
jgi:hypothetical protein